VPCYESFSARLKALSWLGFTRRLSAALPRCCRFPILAFESGVTVKVKSSGLGCPLYTFAAGVCGAPERTP
jgi:hypothetical protein